jgi:hypothetical protein
MRSTSLDVMMGEMLRHLLDHGLITAAGADPRFEQLCTLLLRQQDELDRLLADEAAARSPQT